MAGRPRLKPNAAKTVRSDSTSAATRAGRAGPSRSTHATRSSTAKNRPATLSDLEGSDDSVDRALQDDVDIGQETKESAATNFSDDDEDEWAVPTDAIDIYSDEEEIDDRMDTTHAVDNDLFNDEAVEDDPFMVDDDMEDEEGEVEMDRDDDDLLSDHTLLEETSVYEISRPSTPTVSRGNKSSSSKAAPLALPRTPVRRRTNEKEIDPQVVTSRERPPRPKPTPKKKSVPDVEQGQRTSSAIASKVAGKKRMDDKEDDVEEHPRPTNLRRKATSAAREETRKMLGTDEAPVKRRSNREATVKKRNVVDGVSIADKHGTHDLRVKGTFPPGTDVTPVVPTEGRGRKVRKPATVEEVKESYNQVEHEPALCVCIPDDEEQNRPQWSADPVVDDYMRLKECEFKEDYVDLDPHMSRHILDARPVLNMSTSWNSMQFCTLNAAVEANSITLSASGSRLLYQVKKVAVFSNELVNLAWVDPLHFGHSMPSWDPQERKYITRFKPNGEKIVQTNALFGFSAGDILGNAECLPGTTKMRQYLTLICDRAEFIRATNNGAFALRQSHLKLSGTLNGTSNVLIGTVPRGDTSSYGGSSSQLTTGGLPSSSATSPRQGTVRRGGAHPVAQNGYAAMTAYAGARVWGNNPVPIHDARQWFQQINERRRTPLTPFSLADAQQMPLFSGPIPHSSYVCVFHTTNVQLKGNSSEYLNFYVTAIIVLATPDGM
ncbi:hypothetical protein EIP91_004525 [Steccherinum ochraceum]|uniref:Uncharacterized protein n=1 Tax=Steccherinum ochraceum TaxID=92696 RepID=A0A4R0R9D7_9APHY|nr:hypothetical protein EIP91_004525 [Steccherinum ochraceum]